MVLIARCLHVAGIWGDRGCLSSLWLKTNRAGCKEQTRPSFVGGFPPEASHRSPRSQHGGHSLALECPGSPCGKIGDSGEGGMGRWAMSLSSPGAGRGPCPAGCCPTALCAPHQCPAVPRGSCACEGLVGVGGTHQAARGGRRGAGQRFWCSVGELGGDASSTAELCPFGFREGGC